jgi:hypothetical protein
VDDVDRTVMDLTAPIVLVGAAAGATHVLSGPDHLAAVLGLAGRGRRVGLWTGVRWGVGHALGVVAVGGLAIALREVLPLETLSAWSERFVGVVLVSLGVVGLVHALRTRVHTHVHTHGGHVHVHLHAHAAPHGPDAHDGHEHRHPATWIGFLHGLAGSSHFLGVLPALGLAHAADTLAYVGGFGLGSILAMGGFAAAVGALSARAFLRGPAIHRRLLVGASTACMAVGLAWIAVAWTA